MLDRFSRQTIGVLAGLATGVFWGIPFLAPQVLTGYGSIDIAFGRFFFFGLVSLIFLRPAIRVWRKLSLRQRFVTLALSASGYWLYSSFLFYGVRKTDGVISSLIVGLLPVTVALFGSAGSKFSRAVWIGLLLIGVGLVSLFGVPVYEAYVSGIAKGYDKLGILILVVALTLWTTYAIMNTRFLQANTHIKAKELASLMGVLSFVFMLPIWLMTSSPVVALSHPQLPLFLLFSMLLGVGGSWVANWLWNICSQNCAPHVSGPLIVSETFFGLLYSFIYEARWPQTYEAVAISLLISGVFVSVRSALSKPV